MQNRDSEVWYNITAYISGIDVQQGGRQPNRVGGIEQAAQGLLHIADDAGAFDPINPKRVLGPSAGCRIEVYRGSRRGDARALLFTGYTRGAQAVITPQAEYINVMPLYGELQRAAEIGEGVFARLNGHLTCAEAFTLLLDNAEVPRSQQRADRSDITILASLLNRTTALGQNRQRANLMGALNLVAQAEGGRVYDNRRGEIVFTSRTGYGQREYRATHTIAADEISQRRDLDPSTTVVNIIEGRADAFTSDGQFNRHTRFAEGMLPEERFIPALAEVVMPLTPVQSDGTPFPPGWFIESVEQPQFGFEVKGNIGFARELRAEVIDNQIVIRTRNVRRRTVPIQVDYLTFEIFSPAYRDRIAVRSQASIDLYGPRSAIYPYYLLTDHDSAANRAAGWLEKYKGVIDGYRGARPIRAMILTLPDWNGALFDIDDVCVVTHRTRFKDAFRNKPFWVRGVRHIADNLGSWDIELTLEEVHRVDGIQEIPPDYDPGHPTPLPKPIWPIARVHIRSPRLIARVWIDAATAPIPLGNRIAAPARTGTRWDKLTRVNAPIPLGNRIAAPARTGTRWDKLTRVNAPIPLGNRIAAPPRTGTRWAKLTRVNAPIPLGNRIAAPPRTGTRWAKLTRVNAPIPLGNRIAAPPRTGTRWAKLTRVNAPIPLGNRIAAPPRTGTRWSIIQRINPSNPPI